MVWIRYGFAGDLKGRDWMDVSWNGTPANSTARLPLSQGQGINFLGSWSGILL